ncbi:mechanosensitive ion channel domain-containing protein [Fulvimarina sp. MAC3]|uniref:mechanosensitive ion channel family protein n=1 Tax=Fulvimarina sp. MAC3 TaxID=3148887 RepID=UPI0031FBA449
MDRFFHQIVAWLNWLPDEINGLILIVIAAFIAVGLHKLAMRLVRKALGRRDYWRAMLLRTKGPTRLAFLILFISAAVKAAPFRAYDAEIMSRFLGVGFICLVGWTLVRALQIAADLHLRRFRIEDDDNLLARKHVTQIRILLRAATVLLTVITAAAVLMTFDSVRQYGVSLLAAGGAAGIVVGLAAQPVLSNLLAGIQIAITQPVRIEDAVVVEGEWGWVEEITMTYAVVRLWDWRRLVLPIRYFIENPFQNWTRENGAIIGSVMLRLDFTAPISAIREKAAELAAASPLWDRRVVNVQVSDASGETLEVRILVSANTSPKTWDLRCEMREKLIEWLQAEHPACLPRQRMVFAHAAEANGDVAHLRVASSRGGEARAPRSPLAAE